MRRVLIMLAVLFASVGCNDGEEAQGVSEDEAIVMSLDRRTAQQPDTAVYYLHDVAIETGEVLASRGLGRQPSWERSVWVDRRTAYLTFGSVATDRVYLQIDLQTLGHRRASDSGAHLGSRRITIGVFDGGMLETDDQGRTVDVHPYPDLPDHLEPVAVIAGAL